MPTQGDLVLYNCLNDPMNDTTLTGGGIDTTHPITGGTVGESFATVTENAFPGATQIRYKKNFWKNQNATSPAPLAKLYIQNALVAVTSPGNIQLVSNNSADGSSYQVQVIGYDNSGNPNSELITLNGTSPVTGAITWSQVWKLVALQTGTTSQQNVNGNVTASVSGNYIGMIPAGYFGAAYGGSIWPETTLNDTITIPNDLVNPGSAYGTVTVGGTVTPGDILTITLNGTAVNYTVLSGDTTSTIATALAAALNANGTLNPNFIAYAVSNVVTIAANPAGAFSGVAGNTVTLATSTSGGATETLTPSGATLANGRTVTFMQPRTYQESALSVANSGSLTNGSAQGVWMKQQIPAGLASSPKVQFILMIGWTQ